MPGWLPSPTVNLMSRHGALLMAALAISSVGLAACDPMTDHDFNDTRTESTPLAELHIEGAAGAVTLHRDTSLSQTTIARHFRFRGKQPTRAGWDSIAGKVLTVHTTCGDDCTINY